jgi:hypothetical protein
VLTHAQPGRHIGRLVAVLGDLLDRFGLEFFGISAYSWHLLLGLGFEAQRCLENSGRFNAPPQPVSRHHFTGAPKELQREAVLTRLKCDLNSVDLHTLSIPLEMASPPHCSVIGHGNDE